MKGKCITLKRKWYSTKDNTVINCPDVTYKFNRDTYMLEKRLYWIIAFLGLIISIVVIYFSDNSVVQTVAGAFMGGILSLIVWLFSIRQQDHINYELANIDYHIMAIDEHLDWIHSKVQFIDPDEYDMVGADSKKLVFRFMHLLQLTILLSGDDKIDTSQLMLKYSDGKEYTLKQYTSMGEDICNNKFANLIICQEKWEKVINWNYYTIDRHLNELKKKLLRYKMYIQRGDAPLSRKDLKK